MVCTLMGPGRAVPGRGQESRREPAGTVLLPPALAIVFAALLCAIALLVSGDSPLTALRVMITPVGEGTTAVDIVNSGAIYYISALAVAIGFQMKLFNIGIEGQFRLAACVAAIVGGALTLPPVLHTIVIIIVAVLVGAGWAGIAAVLKAYRGVSEVISTIMLNFLATGLIAYLIRPDSFGVLQGNNISRSDPGERPFAGIRSAPPARCSGWCSWPPRGHRLLVPAQPHPVRVRLKRPESRRRRPPRAASTPAAWSSRAGAVPGGGLLVGLPELPGRSPTR